MSDLDILLLEGTTVGNASLTDLIVGQEGTSFSKIHAVEINSKVFRLRAMSPSEYVGATGSAASARNPPDPSNILSDFGKTSAPHLVLYSLEVSRSASEQQQVYIAMRRNLPSGAPVAAIVTGQEELAFLERWWSTNESCFSTRGGASFVGHACVSKIPKGSLSSDEGIRSQRALHALILKHCLEAASSSEHASHVGSRLTKPSRQNSFAQLSVKGSIHTLYRRWFGGNPVEKSRTPSIRDEERAINVVVLGEVGVGKSSVINLMLGSAVAGVSADSEPFTRESAQYTLDVKGKSFHVYDTEGLQDPQMGLDGYLGPIEKAYKLIRGLNKVDLLLFCIKNGKPTAALRSNYALFYDIICQSKVPFALVITHLEYARKMEQWWKAHSGTINAYGIECAGHACVSSLPDESRKIANRYEESREAVLSLLRTCVDNRKSTMKRVISSTMRGLTRDITRSKDEKMLDTLIRRCELEEDTAQELATRLMTWRSLST